MKYLRTIVLCILLTFFISGCAKAHDAPAAETQLPDAATLETTELNYVVQRNEFFESGNIARELYFEINDNNTVSEVRRVEYSYDTRGNLTTTTLFGDYLLSEVVSEIREYDDDGRLLKVYSYGELSEQYEYNESGNLLSAKSYDNYGNLTSSDEYIYKNGTISGISYMYVTTDSYEDSEGDYHDIIQKNYIYEEYDDNGNLIKVTSVYHDEEPFYELYTYKKNQTVIQEYSLAGIPGFRITLDYDDQGRKIRHLISYPDGEIWSIHEYEYVDHSYKSITYDSDGIIEYYSLEKRDDLGRTIYEASYDAKDNLRASWEYIYDDNGYIESIVNTDQDGNTFVEIEPYREFYTNGNIKTEIFYNNKNYIAPIYRNRYPY